MNTSWTTSFLNCGAQPWALHSSWGFCQCWVKWKDDFTDLAGCTYQSAGFSCIDMTLWDYSGLQSTVSEKSFLNCHLDSFPPSFIHLVIPAQVWWLVCTSTELNNFLSSMYELFWIQNLLASLLLVPHSWWLSENSAGAISLQSSG